VDRGHPVEAHSDEDNPAPARGQFTDRAVHVRGTLCCDQLLCLRPESGERVERMVAAHGTAALDQGRREYAETSVDELAAGGVGGAFWQ
jgi:hypothetical protein